MVVIHFLENKSIVLSQLRSTIPSVDEPIKIKGKKGKVVDIKKIDERVIHVYVEFEKIVVKNQSAAKEVKNKKR
ncbi:hypothetical protein PH210_09360 [Paenibacillus sp. BSR1-1]|uniref:hypothetical protein n=1 Tax=Paenibacillus sp. BSR1-1 TaxID=3020845 RepID=UPI0025B21FA1|nr:hypothetical protein [Paenibacillus sp. BSR1-1]MDN3016408.1 hypothetical protein [Paenibacillus sp. BSR1-1]